MLIKKLEKESITSSITYSVSESEITRIFDSEASIEEKHALEQIVVYVTKGKKRTNIYAKTNDSEDKIVSRAVSLLSNIGETQFEGITAGKVKYKFSGKPAKQNNIVADFLDESAKAGITLNGTIKQNKVKVHIVDSFGKDISIQTNGNEVNLNGKKSYIGAYGRVYGQDEKIDAKAAINEIESLADIKPTWVDFQGKADAILLPMASSVLFSMLAQSASAFDVLNHESFLVDRVNTDVASEVVSIQDRFDGPDFTPFDDENTKCSNFYIVKNGKLLELLQNNTTAAAMKTKNHGNAGIISGAPRNLFLENGSLSYNELLEKTERCIVVNNLWYTRFNNILKGDYSTMPKDAVLLVEKGVVKGAIKNLRISDNILNQLKNVMYFGNDARYVKSWENEIPTHVSSVLVKDVNFTKSY